MKALLTKSQGQTSFEGSRKSAKGANVLSQRPLRTDIEDPFSYTLVTDQETLKDGFMQRKVKGTIQHNKQVGERKGQGGWDL